MFLLVDSSPSTQSAEPCQACKTLIEVGPPPLSQAGLEVISPWIPCRHNKPAYVMPYLGDGHFDVNCA
jgi:hypothetical protein